MQRADKHKQSKAPGKRPVKSKTASKRPIASKTDNKPYHKEQLKAATESMYKYPYLNLSLVDMDGEIWKPFPVEPFDEHYVISNKGRVKRLGYNMQRSDGVCTYLPDRIIKQHANHYVNKHVNEKCFSLTFIIKVNKYSKTFSTARIIYYTFAKPFDLSDLELIIRYKDCDGLNCVPDNLYLFERKYMARWILDNDRRCKIPEVSYREKWSEETFRKWSKAVKKGVSQYDVEGRFLRAFSSTREAARILGIEHTGISAVVKEKASIAGGFVWRKGSEHPPLRIKIPPLTLPVRVAQYNLEGEFIQIFPSLRQAAMYFKVTDKRLSNHLSGGSPMEGFVFKEASYTQEPPTKITITIPAKVRTKRKHELQAGDKYPAQNYSIEDMPGEQWKAIPGTDDIYFASDYGRIKSISHRVEYATYSFMRDAQIITQNTRKVAKTNKLMLMVEFMYKKKRFVLQVSTLIYQLFKGEFSMQYMIRFKDQDTFNCHSDNLMLQHRSIIRKKAIQEGRFSMDYLLNCKPIAQYTLEGELFATYPSLKEAVQKTGFTKYSMINCANGRTKQANGFIWKYIKPDEEVPQQIKPAGD